MKKTFLNWMMAAALVATPMVFTACGDDDDSNDDGSGKNEVPGEPTDTTATQTGTVIDFEMAKLNEDNYWIGDTTGIVVDSDSSFGPTWTCTYTEGVANVNTSYGGFYWSGFAISACTGTTFADNYLGADQYNSIVGKAYTGNNFLIAQNAYGDERITFSKPVTIKSFYYTNAAVAVNSILNGDDMQPKFEDTDWLKCTVNGLRADSTAFAYDIYLAQDGDYVKEWKAAEGLDDFKEVVSLQFSFSGSRNGDYGLDTPAYICLDHFEIEE